MLIGLPVIIYRASEGMDRPAAGLITAEHKDDEGGTVVSVIAFNAPGSILPPVTDLAWVRLAQTLEQATSLVEAGEDNFVCVDRRVFDNDSPTPAPAAIPDAPARKKR